MAAPPAAQVGDGAIAGITCLGDSAVPDDHRESREQDEPVCGHMRLGRATAMTSSRKLGLDVLIGPLQAIPDSFPPYGFVVMVGS